MDRTATVQTGPNVQPTRFAFKENGNLAGRAD